MHNFSGESRRAIDMNLCFERRSNPVLMIGNVIPATSSDSKEQVERIRRFNMKFRHIAIGWMLAALMAVPAIASAAGGSQMGNQSMKSSGTQSMSQQTQSVSAIRTVQNKLNAKGYNVGKADGVWGKRSSRALKKYQQANGLQATGRLDQQTADALGIQSGEFAAFEEAVGNSSGGMQKQHQSPGGSSSGGM